MSQHIAIIGASRGIGLATVHAALARGYRVTALARKPPALRQPDLTWVSGDVQNPVTLGQVLANANAVVTALGVAGMGATTLFSDSARAVTAAMDAIGVRRLVAVTGFGAGDSRGHAGFLMDRVLFPLMLGRVYADKDREEALIRQTRLDWTLVRPGRLTDGTRTGRVMAMTRNYQAGSIARADVAEFIVDCVAGLGFVRKAPVIVEA